MPREGVRGLRNGKKDILKVWWQSYRLLLSPQGRLYLPRTAATTSPITHALLFFFFFFLNKFIYLFMAALGLLCCGRAFSSCGEPGLLFIAVHSLLIAVASLVAEHGL